MEFYELLAILVVCATAGAGIAVILRGGKPAALPPSSAAAIEAGDRWHAHATRLARSLERLLDDPMVSCTIPVDQQEVMRRHVAGFWSDVEGDPDA
jgi:hypothetical protein